MQTTKSAKRMSSGQKVPQDAKKEEFRKYLEKAGVLELLTKSLVQLYEVIVTRVQYLGKAGVLELLTKSLVQLY